MASTVSWIDYSSKEREESMKTLSMFSENDSRDELGIGAIRDSLSDIMFPGTSTLHTRLRYFFFIPWLYKDLEQKKVQKGQFAALADRAERELIKTLMKNDNTDGVIGARVGFELKILPSSMYWSGLRSWGLFKLQASRDEYHNLIGYIYDERRDYEHSKLSRSNRNDDWQDDRILLATTWDDSLPSKPSDFPEYASCDLTYNEAEYLQECIIQHHKGSLLAWLAQNGVPTDVDHVREHLKYADFSSSHKKQIEHAYLFATLIHGAAYLYNLMLAEKANREDLVVKYKAEIEKYETSTEFLNKWDIQEFWRIVDYEESPHYIAANTISFVEEWLNISKTSSSILSDKQAKEIIFKRETHLKRGRSRFVNIHMLDNWGGGSGTRFMNNRWGNVQILLNDLFEGLGVK